VNASAADEIEVSVVLAWPDAYHQRTLRLPQGATLAQALARADFDPQQYSGAVAIYGKLASLQQLLYDGDRIELLRPLQIDPKEKRRRRAQTKN